MNQGLSVSPKQGTVGAGSVATTRTSRERLDGLTGVPTTRCRSVCPGALETQMARKGRLIGAAYGQR